MITKFDTTGGAPATATVTGGGKNTVLYVIVGLAVVYLGYRFIIKPQMDKKKQQQAQ